MFNFHKPRTYRSTEGCCICKAKSSSSRFTDSRKYERDTMQCFDLKYPRQGEICNACVLLVKRFKRLPVGSKRNWSHVVDAKAGIGPGCSKIQTKYKSERISSRAAQANNSTGNTNATSSNGLGGAPGNTTNPVNGASSYMPEKFSKILKKTKKIRDSSSLAPSSKRKSTNNGWSQSGSHSLSTTPDSLDSDYEDARINGALGSSQNAGTNVVEFQTQTRASAYRAQAAAEARKRLVKMGSRRRKLLMPRKNNRSLALEETIDFYDKEEWRERKSCCGMLYECPALGGALLINEANYKPCEQHRPKSGDSQNVCNSENKAIAMPLQKTIIQTMPAVVQLQPPPQASVSTPSVPSTLSLITNTSVSCKTMISTATPTMPTPTPALKKHHLFFKRQSECFPQGDMVAATTHNNINNDTTTTAHVVNVNKTESEFNVPTTQAPHHHHHHPSSSNSHSNTNNLQRHNENAITSSSATHAARILTPSPTLSISVTAASTTSPTLASIMPQMPKHSLAKVTTISPTLMTSTTNSSNSNSINNNNSISNNALPLAKPNGFLHKIKPEPGKIVKHSLEKFNTAVRLKTSDIHDMKPIIKTVDKSYILAKPSTQANVITLNATNSNAATTVTATQNPSLAGYNTTTTSLSAASPTSSTSSTSSTKFSDNSSDSGFDENMLDRKSASPLQEDCEKKILSRPGVHTMFLANGVQIHGQAQNLFLTGNEVAAKILHNRKYSSLTTTTTNLTNNSRSNHHPTTTAVKIAQIPTNPLVVASTSSSSSTAGPSTSMSSAAQAKMRAIYNNNNTIQHENGITTIVPASSLAATTQTAAMQNIAPSTVTITPAPPVGAQYNTQNVISRKLTTANIINLQSNTHISNPHNATSVNHHHASHHHHLNGNSGGSSLNTNAAMTAAAAASQKIILLKTSPNTTTVTATTNYNNLHTTKLSGGGGGLGITR